jgi:hypothetical protein
MNIVESDQFMKQSVPQVADAATQEAALHLKSDQ